MVNYIRKTREYESEMSHFPRDVFRSLAEFPARKALQYTPAGDREKKMCLWLIGWGLSD
jgi:hypothetical protein